MPAIYNPNVAAAFKEGNNKGWRKGMEFIESNGFIWNIVARDGPGPNEIPTKSSYEGPRLDLSWAEKMYSGWSGIKNTTVVAVRTALSTPQTLAPGPHFFVVANEIPYFRQEAQIRSEPGRTTALFSEAQGREKAARRMRRVLQLSATGCERNLPNAGKADHELLVEATYNSRPFEYLGSRPPSRHAQSREVGVAYNVWRCKSRVALATRFPRAMSRIV
ncbi:hypothetical protein F5887DRAFT_924623 [Amanita rubescens]|nr:hypothetical protein F5887DRAFT_924623 [Amanita rubescens]